MGKGWLLASTIVLLMAAVFGIVIAGRPDPALVRHALVVASLQPIGVPEASWQTLVLLATRDSDLSRERLWATWERMERWQTWAQPLIVEAKWLDLPGWRSGARFEQTLDLGFPLRRLHSVETVGAATPGRLASWWRDTGGLKTNQVWAFDDLPGGGTRVTTIGVFHGAAYGFARGVIEEDWQRRFELALDGLLLEAKKPR